MGDGPEPVRQGDPLDADHETLLGMDASRRITRRSWARTDGRSRPTTGEDHRLHRRSRRRPPGRLQQGSPGRPRGEDPMPRPAGTTAQGPGAQGPPAPGRSAMRRPPQRSSRTDRHAAAARPGLPWPLLTRSPAAAAGVFLATLLSRPSPHAPRPASPAGTADKPCGFSGILRLFGSPLMALPASHPARRPALRPAFSR